MGLGIQDAFPQTAFDMRPHHMTLAQARGKDENTKLLAIMQNRKKVWDYRPGRRNGMTMEAAVPTMVRAMFTGHERVWCVVRNPYDLLTTTFLRKGQGQSLEQFMTKFGEPPWIEKGKLFYHTLEADKVLRYENLQTECDALMDELEVRRVCIPRANETANKEPWEIYWTPEAFAIVNDRFGKEFESYYEPRTE